MRNIPNLLLSTDTPPTSTPSRGRPGNPRHGRNAARKDNALGAARAQTEALLAWGAPPGLLPHMPKLRWAQALTAGVETWLALPDLPPDLTLTCARGTHRESMPENILGALFHLTKPYAAIVAGPEAEQWTRRVATPLAGQTLGILGLGAIGQEVARMAAALGMRVIGTKRSAAPMPDVARGVAAGAHRRGSGASRFRPAAAAGHARDRELHQRRAPGADEAIPPGC